MPDAPSASPTIPRDRVPFVLGVTGNMDPLGYDDDFEKCHAAPAIIALRQRVFALLDWLTGLGQAADGRCLDPASGHLREEAGCAPDTAEAYHSCWKPLDLAKAGAVSRTPILILSSLAPGADTLFVEFGLAYAEERGAEIAVRCPLPFPPDLYERASTFNSEGRQARYRQLLARLRATGSGAGFRAFLPERDLFEAQMDNDLVPADGDASADLEATHTDFGKPRRYLRYRAAGEYVATHSDLLVAIYDVEFDAPKANLGDLFESGSATIVESKRSGLTHELLAVSNNFAWADNGPVLVVPIHRKKKVDARGEASGSAGPLRLLHPYDTKPAERATPVDDGDAEWQRGGDELFRRILERQKEFNALPEHPKDENAELGKLVGDAVLSDEATAAFARGFEPIARLRRRAADESLRLGKRRTRILRLMLALIFLAAVSFGAFEHWHNNRVAHPSDDAHPALFAHDPFSLIQAVLLCVSLASLVFSGVVFHRYQQSGTENRRFDYRAIGEALRVQFFWLLTGTGRGAAADYMQRQRDELDWIRYLVSSLAIPIEVSRRMFRGLGREARLRLLTATREHWVLKQKAYFEKNAPKRAGLAHRFHLLGWTLAAAGLLSIVCMLLLEISPWLEMIFRENYLWFALPGLVAGGAMFGKKFVTDRHGQTHGSHAGTTQPRGFLTWIFGDAGTWGGALAVHSLVLLLAFYAGGGKRVWPDEHNAWIILVGAVLLAGGLSVAWAERNFYGEEARMFRAMQNLYTCADRRLSVLLARYGQCADGGVESERVLYEIQDIYYQLGCEALNENAEWLIQHRSRPLEPFMAG